MTLQEIFVLNNILDGQDVYSLPFLSKLNMTQPIYDTAKDMLIDRGLLINYDEFADEGILIAKRLMSFKNAKKYIEILNLSIGVIDNKQAVMIRWNDDNDYNITLIDMKDAAAQLLGVLG